MSAAPPPPEPHARRAEIASRAWTEALSMTGAGPARRPRGEITAAALRAHSALSAGLGQHIPLTVLGPDAGARQLALFLTVYAGRDEQREARDLGAAA
ncbi:hypothetical protein JK359_36580 [Streptomyces actinomycinicus]|uniref:Uncharacterized protein n=1 Tax=Streptomyces actinomycinicus TaxID=1695166 RepID=A0A937ERV3_9ACTN|nr:hypothetical protein [Streptomyces actinomycinicus]MBL1087407.1 hypothetical protein [Streptomyces actinomycinicus]